MQTMQINGWNRLWIAIAIIYLIAIIFMLWVMFPTTQSLYKAWYEDLYLIANISNSEYRMKNSDQFKLENSSFSYPQLIELIENDMKNHPKNFINHCREWSSDLFCDLVPITGKETRKQYENKLSLLRGEQFDILIKAFLLWTTPLIILYLLGWLIGWVYRGFKY
jgi:hypothetical protein